MRALVILRGSPGAGKSTWIKNMNLASLYNATANYFYFWLKGLPEEELEKDIIYLREKYERENKYE